MDLVSHGLCAPTVVAFSDSSMYDSTYPIIYVGIHQVFPPSAWSCPCVSQNYCPQYAAKFIRTRIDRIHWLQCLSHQRLWCDCGADGADCYAAMLVSAFTYDIASADEDTHASFNDWAGLAACSPCLPPHFPKQFHSSLRTTSKCCRIGVCAKSMKLNMVVLHT